MAKAISRYIACTICDEPAQFVTEYSYENNECYLCERHNIIYLRNVHDYGNDWKMNFASHNNAVKHMKLGIK